ncbi:MAG: cytochrome c [Flavobacteriales bacterium]|jgi:mono/diheme cytochrome c family protein|nr:cytochrome c [Flavobacteriales bacterium]
MKIITNIAKPIVASLGIAFALTSCGAGKDDPGYEYMPNMYRSPSYETYGENKIYEDNMAARTPVENTIPRGFMPFEYENNLEGYKKAGEEMKNPFEMNEKETKEGKKLYLQFCAHCHGKKGDGKGSIKNPIYGAVPSYADDAQARRSGSTMKNLTDGHIYHTITYGLNAMGPHASQLTAEERWKITGYVHVLQQGKK